MDFSVVARFGLLLVRPAMVIAVAPALGGAHLPAMVKIGLTIMIAIGLLPSVNIPALEAAPLLTLWIARETAIGLALGFAVRALIAGAEFAGQLSSYQIGFSYGAIIDPQSGVRNNLLAAFYGLLAVVAFLGVNGHHTLLRALAASYSQLPIGAGALDGTLAADVARLLAMIFTVALRLAAPIVIVLLVVELALGLISRAAPALNAMVVGYPVRIIVGLFVLALTVSTIPSVIASLIDRAIALGGGTAASFR